MADAQFWDRIAPKYAARPVANQRAYEETLDHLRHLLRPEDRVLELGCGTGSTALILAPHVWQYTASDFSPAMLDIARQKHAALADAPQNLTFVEAQPGDPVLGDAPFDVVMAFSLLHLVPDLRATLTAIYAHLDHGGLFLSKTTCLGNRGWLLRPAIGMMRAIGRAPHVRFLTAEELVHEIAAVGFKVEDRRTFHNAPNVPFIAARRR